MRNLYYDIDGVPIGFDTWAQLFKNIEYRRISDFQDERLSGKTNQIFGRVGSALAPRRPAALEVAAGRAGELVEDAVDPVVAVYIPNAWDASAKQQDGEHHGERRHADRAE